MSDLVYFQRLLNDYLTNNKNKTANGFKEIHIRIFKILHLFHKNRNDVKTSLIDFRI